MELLLELAIGSYSVIALMLVFLSYTYLKTAISTKARYPAGLFIFSALLLAHAAGTAMWYGMLGGSIVDQAYPFMFGMAGIELVGVAALLGITL